VLRFDGSQPTNATKLRGWVDGAEITLAYTLNIPATVTAAAVNWKIGGLLGLGNASGSGGPVSVWSRALSPEEIVREYQTARTVGTKSDWGSSVSTAVRGGTAGEYLENTDWQFAEAVARYRISTSTHDGETVKTMVCTTGGALYRPVSQLGQSPQEAAYGMWEISFYKPAGGGVSWQFISDLPAVAGFNGWTLMVGTALALYHMTGGIIQTAAVESALGYIADSTWYRVRITRDRLGNWGLWIRGGAYAGWTVVPSLGVGAPHVNPDNTYTSSLYQVMNNGVGQIISLGTVAGNDAVVKTLF
jgi:hypothetical protein